MSTPGPDGSLDAGLTYLRTNKGSAREVHTNAIPIPEAVLARQLAVLVNVSTRLMNSVEEERKRKAEANQHRHMFHNSHTSIEVPHPSHSPLINAVADLPGCIPPLAFRR